MRSDETSLALLSRLLSFIAFLHSIAIFVSSHDARSKFESCGRRTEHSLVSLVRVRSSDLVSLLAPRFLSALVLSCLGAGK